MKRSSILICLVVGATSLRALAASIDEGSIRSIACQACHGGDGISASGRIPNLAGQKVEYLARQLMAFRSGERKHDVMNPIARQLSVADIDDLAAFWSSLPPAGRGGETAPAAELARKSTMKFPAEFPQGFTLYRTDENVSDKRVSKYYANAVAVQAARARKPLPDGSSIVVAMSPAKLNPDQTPTVDVSGHLTAEPPGSYSAMEARSGSGDALPDLLRNGNWTYALFDAQRVRNDRANYAQCLGCHKAVAADSYVFSLKQLAGEQ